MRSLVIIIILILTSCKTRFAEVKFNNKFGVINHKGIFVVQPIWDDLLLDDKYSIVQRDSLWGYIDTKGKIVIKPKYNDADYFYEGLAAVNNGDKYGFIDYNGDTIIKFQFDDVNWGFTNGLSVVRINDKCGYVNNKGKIVIPCKYFNCYPFHKNFAQVEEGYFIEGDTLNEWLQNKLIRKSGITYKNDWNVKQKFLFRKESYPGSIESNKGRGRIKENGDTIIPPVYSSVGNFTEGRSIVCYKGKWGVYNKKGKIVVQLIYDGLTNFSEGLSAFTLNKKYGFINKNGQIVIPPIYDFASSFKNRLAYIELNGKSGFINKKGKIVILPKFDIYRQSTFW